MIQFDVIILAGGFGTRLQSVVSDVPKPMAPINGRPFLEFVLDKLPTQSIGKVVLAVGYKNEVIQEHFGSKFNGLQIEYCIEEQPLGTGGAIKLAMSKVENESCVILNGDTFFDIDFEHFYQTHTAAKADISLALKQIISPDRYGTVLLENDRIVRFTEKQSGLSFGLINGGIYWVNQDVENSFPNKENFSFESEFLEKVLSQLKVAGYIDSGRFIDIGIPSDYERAHEILAD